MFQATWLREWKCNVVLLQLAPYQPAGPFTLPAPRQGRTHRGHSLYMRETPGCASLNLQPLTLLLFSQPNLLLPPLLPSLDKEESQSKLAGKDCTPLGQVVAIYLY